MTQANVLAQLGAQSGPTFRNRIINGAMVIDQRNGGASINPANGGYSVDRWKIYNTPLSKLTAQQNAGSITPPAGFTNYLGITSSSAYTVSGGDYFAIDQTVEGYNIADLGWGTANAKTVTLSAWVRSSLTGTFGGNISNGAESYSYPFTYTISSANTWTQISITIAGPTAGTWLTTNGSGLEVNFGLGIGSTYGSGTAGAWAGGWSYPSGCVSVVGTNGATFYITGVQLEVGSSATGFEYRQYQQELALCQRYLPAYSANGSSGNSPQGVFNQGASTTRMWGQFIFPVTTRTAPTGVTISSASHYIGAGQNTNMTLSAINVQYASTSSASCYFDGSGGTSTQNIVLISQNASALIYFTGCEL